MDLFENYHQLSEELQAVLDKWQQKEANMGLDYKDCKAFQEECEAVGYTFDYQLDAQPFNLRPLSSEKQQLSNVIDHHNPDNIIPTNETQAADLPKGWSWNDYDDGSGSLKSPNGNSYYSYDLQTQEYRLPYGKNEWAGMKDVDETSKSLNEFKVFAEIDLTEKAQLNHLSPKLSKEEINDLLDYRNSTKEQKFILEDLNITQHQRESYLEEKEFGTTSGDYSLSEEQLRQLPDFVDGHHLSKNDKYELAYGLLQKQQYAEAYSILPGGEIIKMFLDEEEMSAYRPLSINEIKYNNQNPDIMETQKDFDQVQYLKDQMKYLGFGEGEQLHKDLEKAITSSKTQFELKTSSDKTLPENKVGFLLRFNKTDSGGVFFNSYHAILENKQNETIHQKFQVNKEHTFTAKEAVNLLEGRAVKIEFKNAKTEQMEPAFVQLNFDEPKTDNGNYYFKNFYKNYGVDTTKIVEKAELVFDRPEWKDNAIKSLEKGNIVKVKFKQDDSVIEGKAVLDPQNRNLKLYDNDMNRLNTNKPLEGLDQDHKHEKNNVKEQSIKR
ncbi:hypothetical protein ACFO4P_08430 [Epilithonimonas pallida]|uniref:DUF3945 domain-containing protein n=1 Tax=Epilithonimonas pallida TaxID=373671 RepID=A0ABY1R723_9FLAO|nr:hypothetical protein [Epilithonimonas pallida]SMP93798.1 hypothetical protein SAMN05421679_105103 [Epilithonimonas pallida]